MRAPWCMFVVAIGMTAVPCAAQDADIDPPLTREQWMEQVEEKRLLIEQMRRERRSFAPIPPTPEQLADQRVRDALDDPGLMPGDLVVTRRGLYQYRGTPDNRERLPEDFVRLEKRPDMPPLTAQGGGR